MILTMMGRDESKEDVVLILGNDEERKALHVLRKRDDRIEAGLVRAAEPGKPLLGDLVRLKPRAGLPFLCDVETLYEFRKEPETDVAAPPRLGHAGPAWVTTDAYREGWERIFGKSRVDPEAN